MKRLLLLALHLVAACHHEPKPAAPRDEDVVVPPDPPRPPVRVGDRIPTVHLATQYGRELPLHERGVTVLVLWATWSEPGKKCLYRMQALHERRGKEGVRVLGLSIDDEPRGVADALKQWGVTFPVAWDRDHVLAEKLRFTTEPTIYVTDESGVIRFVHDGYRESDAETIEREALSLVKR